MFGSSAVLVVIGPLIAGLIAMWVIQIIAARFLWKGYEGIADKTGTEAFRFVGRLYFYGTLLVTVLVGVVLAFVAGILQI
jgi:uncharacterized membrane protein